MATKGIKFTSEHKQKIGLANKGKKRTLEMNIRSSEAHRGYKMPIEQRNKISNSNKGKIGFMKGKFHSEETKNKIRQANLGHSRKGWKLSDKTREKMKGKTPWNKGKKGLQIAWNKGLKGVMKAWNKGKKFPPQTMEQRKRQSLIMINKKESLWNWKGGISPLCKIIRENFKYRQWRSDIFMRDDYTCIWCRRKGLKLNAHHIKPFSIILQENNVKTIEQAIDCEELWNINNGITLCEECHKKTDSFKSKAKNYK